MRASIAFKVFLGFAAVLLAFGLVAVYSIYKMDHVRARLVLISDTYVPLTQILTQALSLQNREEELLKSVEENPQVLQLGVSRFPKKLPDDMARAKSILTAAETPASRFDEELLSTTQRRLDEISRDAEAYVARRTELERRVALKEPLNPGFIRELRDRQQRLGLKLGELLRFMQSRVKNAADRAQEVETNSTIAVGLLSMLALAIGVGVAALAGLTLRPLSQLAAAARSLGRGEEPRALNLKTGDEIGALAGEFDRMVRSLRARDQNLRDKNQALEALTRFHSDIIRSISTGIVVVRKDGVVRGYNPASALLFGLTPEVEGQVLTELPLFTDLSPELRAQLQTEIARALGLRPERPEPLRALLVRTGGKERRVDLRAVPFADANGDIDGFLLLSDDVSEELRAKERLLQSERLATVGRMAAQVAHEIRNPLSSIGLNAELLEDDLAHAGEGKKLLKAIQSEVDRLTAITEDYLRYARLPSPQLAPRRLNDFVQALAEFLGPEAEARKIALSLQLSPEASEARFDDAQLRQALLNLVRNAFEALGELPEGERRVVLSTRREEEFFDISVSDTGPGLSSEALSRLFEPFFSTKSGGTGLGLALTQQIAEGHGGQLAIRSTPSGATFTVRLPASLREEAPDERA